MTREMDAARRAHLRSALVKAARAEDPSGTLCARLIAITAPESASAATSPAAAGPLRLAPTVTTGANAAVRWKLLTVLLALGAAGAVLVANLETVNVPPVTVTAPPAGQPAPVVAAPTAAVPIAVPAEMASVSAEDLPSVKAAPIARTARPAPPASVAVMGAPVVTATAAPVSSLARPAARLADETRAVGAIRAAVYAGRTSDALRLLDAYEAEFPSGALAEEAEVLRIEAFARAGNRTELARYADRFLTERPSSAHAARVEAIKERHAAPDAPDDARAR